MCWNVLKRKNPRRDKRRVMNCVEQCVCVWCYVAIISRSACALSLPLCVHTRMWPRDAASNRWWIDSFRGEAALVFYIIFVYFVAACSCCSCTMISRVKLFNTLSRWFCLIFFFGSTRRIALSEKSHYWNVIITTPDYFDSFLLYRILALPPFLSDCRL